VRKLLTFVLCCASAAAWAAPRQVDATHWEGVDRIVAIGDVHGDYAHYLAALNGAGLVNDRGHWIGGATHLVQTGDIPDRGPDTRRILLHLQALAREAEKAGGHVHALMGNHEAMNVTGDLRYVTEGEYAAFADKGSAKRRDAYFAAVLAKMKQDDPAAFAALPADYRATWDREHPLGWLEQRAAWDPRWHGPADLYQWVLQEPVAIRIDDLLFVHGGIGGDYCAQSLEALTTAAHAALRAADPAAAGILEDPQGPLWYRGLAGVAPAPPLATVDAMLERYGVRHIVIGHTPTGGVIWPRLDGRVVQVDVGMTPAYGGHVAWLEATKDGLVAGYPGGKVPLPLADAKRADYLDAVIALVPSSADLQKRRDALRAGVDPVPDAAEAGTPPAAAPAAVTCGISP
jgi:hypothetical protein